MNITERTGETPRGIIPYEVIRAAVEITRVETGEYCTDLTPAQVKEIQAHRAAGGNTLGVVYRIMNS